MVMLKLKLKRAQMNELWLVMNEQWLAMNEFGSKRCGYRC